jgi:hypothetical protein
MLGMALARVPRRGEKVRVEGHPDRLVVVRVDRVNNIANVEMWENPSVVLRGVPFDAIRLIRETTSEAAQQLTLPALPFHRPDSVIP